MAQLVEIGQAVNDGEKIVLRRLREELPADWTVVSNFEVPSGKRMLECDAVAFAPGGWAYLIETKALVGQIEGNERQWSMPSLVGDERYYITNPIHVVRRNVKKLASMLREHDARLVDLRIFPVIVVVSDLVPRLSGPSAHAVVIDRFLSDTVVSDPRPAAQPHLSPDLVASAIDALTASARPMSPTNRVNAWELLELIDAHDAWEIWCARHTGMGPHAPLARLKRFLLDTLATGEDHRRQQLLARRDLDALIRLAGVDGAVPLLSTVEETEDSISATQARRGRRSPHS